MTIHCDRQNDIYLTKYINVRLHFIREVVGYGKVRIMKITSSNNSNNLADVFTKYISRLRFRRCLKQINFI